MDEFIDDERPAGKTPGAGATVLVVVIGMHGLLALGLGAARFFAPRVSEAPARVAADPLLAEGRRLYLDRCLSCHGDFGRGDGPIARSLQGPPPGDLTDAKWIHGDRPEQVLKVINDGVIATSMPGWKSIFTPEQVRAVSAYVYELAGRPVPEELRQAPAG